MEKQHTYRTIANSGTGFYKEKGSKFHAFAVHCTNEDDARSMLQQWRKEHHLAVHVCYAFRFGSDKKRFRASDDGEPSNSAGPPILGQIQSFDLTNVLIAVVRYYGGTNLGVGGLINAYRTSAREAIEQAEIVEKEDQIIVEVRFGYEQMPAVMQLVKSTPVNVLIQDFGIGCYLKLECPASQPEIITAFSSIQHSEVISHGINI